MEACILDRTIKHFPFYLFDLASLFEVSVELPGENAGGCRFVVMPVLVKFA